MIVSVGLNILIRIPSRSFFVTLTAVTGTRRIIMANGDGSKTKIWEWVRWGVTALILPILVWAWSLQSKVDESEHRVRELEKDMTSVESDIKEDNGRIQRIEISVARIEGKLDNANETLEVIKGMLKP